MTKRLWLRLCIVLISFSVIMLIAWLYNRTLFTPEKWQAATSQQRGYMLNDLLKKHNIVGLSKSEVVSLLGEGYAEGNDYQYSWCYHMGDGFLLTMDLLYIEFENDIAVDCYVHTMNV